MMNLPLQTCGIISHVLANTYKLTWPRLWYIICVNNTRLKTGKICSLNLSCSFSCTLSHLRFFVDYYSDTSVWLIFFRCRFRRPIPTAVSTPWSTTRWATASPSSRSSRCAPARERSASPPAWTTRPGMCTSFRSSPPTEVNHFWQEKN